MRTVRVSESRRWLGEPSVSAMGLSSSVLGLVFGEYTSAAVCCDRAGLMWWLSDEGIGPCAGIHTSLSLPASAQPVEG